MRRHPVRAFFGGLLFGIGVALMLIFFGAAILGTFTLVALVILFAVLGVALAWVLPARSARPRA